MYSPDQARGLVLFDCDGTLIDEFTHQEFPGLKKLLHDLVENQFCLALWTGRSRASCFKLLKELGMMPYFWELYCGDDPFPKPQIRDIKELSSQFKTIVMFGDSKTDIIASKSVGAKFIWAAWNPHVPMMSTFKESQEDFCLDPSNALEIVKSQLREGEE